MSSFPKQVINVLVSCHFNDLIQSWLIVCKIYHGLLISSLLILFSTQFDVYTGSCIP